MTDWNDDDIPRQNNAEEWVTCPECGTMHYVYSGCQTISCVLDERRGDTRADALERGDVFQQHGQRWAVLDIADMADGTVDVICECVDTARVEYINLPRAERVEVCGG